MIAFRLLIKCTDSCAKVGTAVHALPSRRASVGCALSAVPKAHIVFRDCMALNIMVDARPMYPGMYHPRRIIRTRDYSTDAKYFSRTERPVKYYLIDFGLSRRYPAHEKNPLEIPILGGDKTVPEFLEDPTTLRDPFPTDVYYLGNVIRRNFLDVRFTSSLTFTPR